GWVACLNRKRRGRFARTHEPPPVAAVPPLLRVGHRGSLRSHGRTRRLELTPPWRPCGDRIEAAPQTLMTLTPIDSATASNCPLTGCRPTDCTAWSPLSEPATAFWSVPTRT